ncbi:MAG: hypothetical protein ABI325_02180 [Ginsengibacter sp.]
MERPTKILLIIIGVLSILTGIYSYFYKSEPVISYSAIFIGVAIIGIVFFIKPKKKD